MKKLVTLVFFLNTNIGIKPNFPFINSLGLEGSVENRGRSPRFSTLREEMNDKNIFDRYYCINFVCVAPSSEHK